MKVTPGRMFVFMIAALVGTAVLAVVLHAAGKPVALGVAIAALAAMPLSYVRIAVMAVRARKDAHALERIRRYGPVHFGVVFGGQLVVTAAWPWGPVSPVVGFATLMLCQIVFLHWGVAAALVLRSRARRAPPS
jgi:putative flippase GtrA